MISAALVGGGGGGGGVGGGGGAVPLHMWGDADDDNDNGSGLTAARAGELLSNVAFTAAANRSHNNAAALSAVVLVSPDIEGGEGGSRRGEFVLAELLPSTTPFVTAAVKKAESKGYTRAE